MKNAYIIDGTRSAIGNFKGNLAPVRTDDLMASVLKSLIEKNPNLPLDQIDDVLSAVQIKQVKTIGISQEWLCFWLVFRWLFRGKLLTASVRQE